MRRVKKYDMEKGIFAGILNEKYAFEDAFLLVGFLSEDYSSSKRISRILLADLDTFVPGPKIAATPALYKKS